MAELTKSSFNFLASYERQYQEAQGAAKLIRGAVTDCLMGTSVFVQAITARAKTPKSLRGKLRRKRYSSPSKQVTDLIGVRVITYHRDDVDEVVKRLEENFEIDHRNSVDKRVQLGLRGFGYRSVHLITRLKSAQVRNPTFQILRDWWFEVQVRSILEHAWAEIEHEIVYKSGISYPEEIVRQFAALAGTLELLDNEFLALRNRRNSLIDKYRESYDTNNDMRKSFDVARLLGFLESFRSGGLSWRQAAASGTPFAAGLDVSCVDALKAVGLGTPASLSTLIRSGRFRYAVSSFASSQGIAPSEVSHLAIVVLAIVVKNPRMLQRHFPEIVYDLSIEQMVQRRVAR